MSHPGRGNVDVSIVIPARDEAPTIAPLVDEIAEAMAQRPDLSYEVVQMVADGEKVWGHFRSRGTNDGSFMGNPPAGKTMQIDVIDIARYEGGKLVEHWGVPDRLGLLLQLGFFPPKSPS